MIKDIMHPENRVVMEKERERDGEPEQESDEMGEWAQHKACMNH